MGKKCKLTDKETEQIIDLYVNQSRTMSEISCIMGNVSYSTVNRILKKNNINIRKKGDLNGKKRNLPSPFKQEVDDVQRFKELFFECKSIKEMCEILGVGKRAIQRKINELNLVRPKSMKSRSQYDDSKDKMISDLYDSGLSPNEISKKVGLTRCTIKNHLKHCGIELRSISDGLFCYNKKIFPKELNTFEILYDMYAVQRLSKKDIAATLNVSPSVVERCLKKFNIHIRGSSESKYGLCAGNKHPNWKGGRTELYARLREYFRVRQTKQIIKRDNNKCQLCGCAHNLQVHHIKHFKDIFEEILNENKNLDLLKDKEELFEIMKCDKRINDDSNLITYCKDCHLYKIHGYKKHKDIKKENMSKVIKIGAEWCGPCRALDKQLETFKGCEVIKYDVDENESIVEEYNVRSVPVTILLDDTGNEIKRWIGLFNVNEINDELERLKENV